MTCTCVKSYIQPRVEEGLPTNVQRKFIFKIRFSQNKEVRSQSTFIYRSQKRKQKYTMSTVEGEPLKAQYVLLVRVNFSIKLIIYANLKRPSEKNM